MVDKVLRKFLTAPRHPLYLDNPKYAHLTERNKEIYMTSAYFKKHWSWEKVQAYCTNLVDDSKKYFVCGLPYQLSIAENLLQREAVEDEMSEEDFNSITWDMEMGCMFYGESEDAFFSYENFLESRTIPMAFYPSHVYNNVGGGSLKPPPKKDGEIRLVCVDVAVMGSKRHKNDATAIHILQLVPNSRGQFTRNLVYSTSMDGGHSEVQGLKVRKLYEDMYADYIVIDGNGVGNGIVDVLMRDLTDPETGEIYPALTCKNNEEIAAKYQGASKNPVKAIYSIRATAASNSTMAQNLKDICNRRKLHMLINEREADMQLKKIKGFASLSPEWKEELLKPYIQATLTINEIVNLEYEVTPTAGVRIYERQRSDRKDRYSALAYGNQVATELEREYVKKTTRAKPAETVFNFRRPQVRRR